MSFLRPQNLKFTDFPILSEDFWREDAERMSEGAAPTWDGVEMTNFEVRMIGNFVLGT